MKTRMTILFVLIFFVKGISQDISKEQVAFDYFFKSGFIDEFKICKIEFKNQTENEFTNFGILKPCYSIDIAENLFKFSKQNKGVSTFISSENMKSKIAFKKKSKFKLSILKSVKISDKYYVSIEVYKKKDFSVVYFFTIDENNNIIEWCKTGATY